MIRDMVRQKPMSWLLFILGSDILTAYVLNVLHHQKFDMMRDYFFILKLVTMDLLSFVLIMMVLDWLHTHFFSGQSENWFDKLTRVGGNIMAAYFGWFSLLYIGSQIFCAWLGHMSYFQKNQLYGLMLFAGLMSTCHFLLRRRIPWSFQLNPFGEE